MNNTIHTFDTLDAALQWVDEHAPRDRLIASAQIQHYGEWRISVAQTVRVPDLMPEARQ